MIGCLRIHLGSSQDIVRVIKGNTKRKDETCSDLGVSNSARLGFSEM